MIIYQKLKDQNFTKKTISSVSEELVQEELTQEERITLNELYDKVLSELNDFNTLLNFNVKNIDNKLFGIINYYDSNDSFRQKRF
jgi:hypothetical protein